MTLTGIVFYNLPRLAHFVNNLLLKFRLRSLPGKENGPNSSKFLMIAEYCQSSLSKSKTHGRAEKRSCPSAHCGSLCPFILRDP